MRSSSSGFPGSRRLLPPPTYRSSTFNLYYYYPANRDVHENAFTENGGGAFEKRWRGPRKVIVFCLLAVFLPCAIVSVALIMRFLLHGSALYHLAPSDMRLLDHRISTTWCQSELVTVNGTFNAYLTDGEPEIIKSVQPVEIERNIIIPDDHKEYWGFYLLEGSTFKVYTCARFKGGTLLIVRGRNHLEHCAYIGEGDSAGNSDELSSSNSNEGPPSKKKEQQVPTSVEEMGSLLAKIRDYVRSRPSNYGRLKENLANWMLINSSSSSEHQANSTILPEPPQFEHGTIARNRRSPIIRRLSGSGGEEDADAALEEMDPGPIPRINHTHPSRGIWSDHHGILNHTASQPNEGSNSESESSWSSSEEAMAKCEGVLGSFQLKGQDACDAVEDGWGSQPFFQHLVNSSGYYYFIFGSENEKRDNIIRAKFELDKFVYNLPEPLSHCQMVQGCMVNFTFASNQKLVITIPEPPERDEGGWNRVYVAESHCTPRTSLYLIFVITVPLLILLCAFQ